MAFYTVIQGLIAPPTWALLTPRISEPSAKARYSASGQKIRQLNMTELTKGFYASGPRMEHITYIHILSPQAQQSSLANIMWLCVWEKKEERAHSSLGYILQ